MELKKKAYAKKIAYVPKFLLGSLHNNIIFFVLNDISATINCM